MPERSPEYSLEIRHWDVLRIRERRNTRSPTSSLFALLPSSLAPEGAGETSCSVANYFKDFAAPVGTAVVILFIREYVPQLWRAYQSRYVDPKIAHRQVFLDQADWFEERASKLAVFRFELGQEPKPDKFKLAQLVSKLDPQDRQWAMKQTDIEVLRKCAAEKGAECHDNAGECARSADEIAYRTFIFRI
jgi:hypothetical protein